MHNDHMFQISATLDVNGEKRMATFRPADTLLYVLRNQLGLTGCKTRMSKRRLRGLYD